jgi:hypothetical protein
MVIFPTRAVLYVEIAPVRQLTVLAEQDLLVNESRGAKALQRGDSRLRLSREAWSSPVALRCTFGMPALALRAEKGRRLSTP